MKLATVLRDSVEQYPKNFDFKQKKFKFIWFN